ncbi:MAG: hypothetical protein A2020_15255 [Lentisphaerae bacterium GWF2_45_14]|nr:MAG: hypothetical protein A2020_15255 [Lentisphaerae bacterium GWF2_45_14]
MELSIAYITLISLVGLIASISGGFWGIGGGWLILPALLIMGVPHEIAAPACLLQMVPSSAPTVIRQFKKIGWAKDGWGWRVAVPLSGMCFIGGFLGKPAGILLEEIFNSRTPHQMLYMVLLFYVFFNTLMSGEADKNKIPGHWRSRLGLTMFSGFCTGVFSALLGIGGGTINRPVMKSLLKVPEKPAGMIARLSVLLTAFSGCCSYFIGVSNWSTSSPAMQALIIGVILSIGGVLGFPLGSRMHAMVLNAEGGLTAHRSFAWLALLISISIGCKLCGMLLTGQMILIVSGLLLTAYLVGITYRSWKYAKQRRAV